MTTQSTMDKLIEMRLTAMSDAFRTQISDPKMKEISFEDRFGMLVDIEYSNRKSNSLKRLIRNAGFDQPDAYIGDINYTSGRKLNRSLIERLATCEYITEHRNLFITGATGSGKTYLACAFGMEACRQRYKTKYVRLPDLLLELEMARNDGTYKKVQGKYANPVLLIIDEWLRGCKIFCVYGNETFQIRIRYVVVFVGFCSRVFCRIYLSGYSISCPLSFMHAF